MIIEETSVMPAEGDIFVECFDINKLNVKGLDLETEIKTEFDVDKLENNKFELNHGFDIDNLDTEVEIKTEFDIDKLDNAKIEINQDFDINSLDSETEVKTEFDIDKLDSKFEEAESFDIDKFAARTEVNGGSDTNNQPDVKRVVTEDIDIETIDTETKVIEEDCGNQFFATRNL